MNDIVTQYGEKKHLEYGWSSDIQEELFQLTYQLTRCNSQRMGELTNRLESIIKKIIICDITLGKYQELMITAYKLIGYTRDVIYGKGECDLAYMQIIVWYKFYPNLAKYALRCFVQLDDGSHPYGSWKDIKYFCNYCINSGLNEDHQLIQYSLELITDQLRKEQYDSIHTLVAKWVPREKSNKFGWLFEKLAILYFPEYMKTATTYDKKVRALRKAKTEYRRLISKLNETLQTVQIKQCNGRWSQIDHSRTTSITMHKQKRSFLNLNDNNLEDRIQCSKKLIELINDNNSCKDINGKRIRLNDFTKDAIRMLRNDATTQVELDIINSQWRNSSNQTSKLGPMIAMLDCGNSMSCNDDGNPFYAALAVGCRIAEKSILGKRILTFSSNPTWHNLEMCDTFTKMVKSIIKKETSLSSNFEKALDLILDAYVEQQLDAEETNGITLAILSDMQINENEKLFELEILYDKIKDNYSETGIKICGKPYKPPHILFWNFRSTSGFPCLSNTKNVSMISGYNPTFLNRFNEKDFKGLQATSPWLNLFESMNRQRYKYMENKIKRELMFFE